MSGYIGDAADAASEIAMDTVDNGVAAIREQMKLSYGQASLSHCMECGDEIPEGRQKAVPGVKYCVYCQEDHMVSVKYKMLTQML